MRGVPAPAAARVGVALAEAGGGRHDGGVRHRPQPVSPAGERAWQLADEAAQRWEPGAEARDRQARFDPSLVKEVQLSGLSAACAPAELGGGGVDQLRDVMALAHRLAEADGSLALAVHMHLSGTWSLARGWRQATGGHPDPNDGRTALLSAIAAGDAWLCAAVTESGTNFFHPRTTLVERAGHGWILHGVKVFATGSPAATHFSANARMIGGARDGQLAQVIVEADLPGVRVEDNWDGLGMRASGSGVVHFDEVALPADATVLPGGPFGRYTVGALCGRAFGNVGNVTAMAGIASAARRLARQRAGGGQRITDAPLAQRATVRHGLAELETDYFALEAVIDLLGRLADAMAERLRLDPAGVEEVEARQFMADFQTAKLNVNRLAGAVVDRALALAGGGGYTAGNPLSRLCRDVRAGQFMQPFSPHEALGFVGAIAAGVEPDVEA